jgi:endonuclease III
MEKYGMVLSKDELKTKAWTVYQTLLGMYGEHPLNPRREPMHELISTMLSHRTTAANEKTAYTRMRERFGSWEGVRDAPLPELIEAISTSNFPEAKAPNIKKTLARIIDERGQANIDFLADLPTEEGLEWLMSLPGVGIKTATLVLLFCFKKPIMPVDTHVHRVSGRLGLIGPKVNSEAAHHLLLDLLPPEPHVLYNFHIDVLRHGQKLCVWGTPRCAPCSLKGVCDWYNANHKS